MTLSNHCKILKLFCIIKYQLNRVWQDLNTNKQKSISIIYKIRNKNSTIFTCDTLYNKTIIIWTTLFWSFHKEIHFPYYNHNLYISISYKSLLTKDHINSVLIILDHLFVLFCHTFTSVSNQTSDITTWIITTLV